jgi:histone deacetylase 1/2
MNLRQGGGSESSANMASRGGRSGNNGCGRNGRGRGRGGGRTGGRGDGSPRPVCQLCGKEGHTVIRCYKRFDTSFQGVQENKYAASTITNSYGIDTNWYTDTGATDHISRELEKLSMRDDYMGGDQVHTASGSSMEISQIGRDYVHTPDRNLVLNNVLFVPQANKNLVSVHKLALDNDAFLEFHPHYFFIKDRATKRTLLQGRCEGKA